ncbi:MAG: hypothetical protein JNJ57_04765 [Saprospiraceae bacterium]|nr:hypothetical protein [Saprospiraceae bacterium]
MKQIVVWLLVCQFASGHNLLAELVRTPSLIDHFQVHKVEDTALTFTGFIWLHYFNNTHETSDSRHESLPLHCIHVVLAESTVDHPPVFENALSWTFCESARVHLIFDEFFRPTASLTGVFRPPIV